MTTEKLEILKTKLQKFNIIFDNVNDMTGVYIDKNDVLEVCKILKEDPELKFDSLVDAVSVDRFQKKERFEMIYNILSLDFNERIFIKIKLDSKIPEMQSLTQVWKSANWYEREAYDMIGINFINHPDLRRMYMPEEFEYFPLRKDFPLMGIPDSIPLPNK
ncbi:MAG: NADH-quinone oxidoreductase subunit C [Ignavibacteria bacterium]|nr:NADH-quinone oxidoreductase subunit C [Ignavibacteria bacterium]